MRVESDGHSPGNPRLYEVIENAPKTGTSPTIWAWPQFVEYLKDPTDVEATPTAIPDPASRHDPRTPDRSDS